MTCQQDLNQVVNPLPDRQSEFLDEFDLEFSELWNEFDAMAWGEALHQVEFKHDEDEFTSDPYTDFSLPVALKF